MTAWIFGLQIARTWWNTSLMAPLFVVSAILSGTALVTLLALAAERFGKVELASGHEEVAARLHRRQPSRRPVLRGRRLHHRAVGQRPGRPLGAQPRAAGRTLVLAVLGRVDRRRRGAARVPARARFEEDARRARPGVGSSSSSASSPSASSSSSIGFINPLTQFPPGNAVGTYNPATTSFQLIGRYHPTWVEYGIVIGLVALVRRRS